MPCGDDVQCPSPVELSFKHVHLLRYSRTAACITFRVLVCVTDGGARFDCLVFLLLFVSPHCFMCLYVLTHLTIWLYIIFPDVGLWAEMLETEVIVYCSKY